jgi:hypothetical protein
VKCAEIPQFLHDNRDSKTCCENLATNLGGLRCEQESLVPGLSPGIVEAGEALIRYLVSDDIEEGPNGGRVVKPRAFSHSGTNGLSVDRYQYRSKARTAEVVDLYIGYVKANCASIRELVADGSRCFAVYDTAVTTNLAHADICQCLFTPKSQQAKYRRRLKDAFDRTPVLFEELTQPQTVPSVRSSSLPKKIISWACSLWRRCFS